MASAARPALAGAASASRLREPTYGSSRRTPGSGGALPRSEVSTSTSCRSRKPPTSAAVSDSYPPKATGGYRSLDYEDPHGQ